MKVSNIAALQGQMLRFAIARRRLGNAKHFEESLPFLASGIGYFAKKMTEKKTNVVCAARLKKYFKITGEALEMAKKAEKGDAEKAADFLDMAQRYYDDAKHFESEGHIVNAFAALNYAHGWLDAGARAGFFKVNDNRLFTVDD